MPGNKLYKHPAKELEFHGPWKRFDVSVRSSHFVQNTPTMYCLDSDSKCEDDVTFSTLFLHLSVQDPREKRQARCGASLVEFLIFCNE